MTDVAEGIRDAATTDDHSLVEVVRQALQSRPDGESWQIGQDGFWCRITPCDHTLRPQGWKLHVSGTMPGAHAVLSRCVPVLLDAGCAFKFAAELSDVYLLNSGHAPRWGAGKFLTVYPACDAVAVSVAEALHAATMGLAGPAILSDRPYKPSSLVHYRYGSFVDQRVLSYDGMYRDIIRGPGGQPCTDRREARFAPPDWASSPFASVPKSVRRKGSTVLLGDRFMVREAIRHANKGGVYWAHDTESNQEVVIKEARPHVAVASDGTDVRDVLRAEARVLKALAPRGLSPAAIVLFEQNEHVFLVQERMQGVTLRQWVLNRLREVGSVALPQDGLRIAQQLAELLRAVHDAGIVVRDFNPNNVMVLDDGDLRLIDFELSAWLGEDSGDLVVAGGTPYYSAPEQLAGATPDRRADAFSLGATILFAMTAADPQLPADDPVGRPLRDRAGDWLRTGSGRVIPAPIRTLIIALMDDEPGRRPDADQARELLAEPVAIGHKTSTGGKPEPVSPLTETQWSEAVTGIVDHLVATMTPDDEERLWPVAGHAPANDPCNLQHGAAGVLGVLVRYFDTDHSDRIATALATTAEWIERRLDRDSFRPPGLYFGQAGIAWALCDAARALGDSGLADRATQMALRLPTEWPNPDITHGTAGIGLTSLHFWQHTGDERFAQRAARSAEALLASAMAEPRGLSWQTPENFDSLFAGDSFYGFAHGTAGIGYFLLAASRLRPDCLAVAEKAADALYDTAITTGVGARWTEGKFPDDTPMHYWCSGSAGVGTFLLRQYEVTGDERARTVAEMAAQASVEFSWPGPVGQCHGLAGNAEFLLDMAKILGEPRYQQRAGELARTIYARRFYRQQRAVFPDDEGTVSAEWASGLSGLLAFLLRLRYGGARLWMTDALLPVGTDD